MKKLMAVMFGVIFAVCISYTAIAGSLDSPGAPSAGSGMYTLQNLYDYLVSGTAFTVQSGFQEPLSAPGSTMKSTKEIGDAIAGKFTLCNATAYDVALGKTFFCTQSGSWGVQTGKVCIAGTPTPTVTPTPTTMPWGATACAAKGGLWRATQLASPNDFGCWIWGEATYLNTCTDICSTKSLSCAEGNWNDDTSCSICTEFSGTTNCVSNPDQYMPMWWHGYPICYYRITNNKLCSSPHPSTDPGRLLCVCVP